MFSNISSSEDSMIEAGSDVQYASGAYGTVTQVFPGGLAVVTFYPSHQKDLVPVSDLQLAEIPLNVRYGM